MKRALVLSCLLAACGAAPVHSSTPQIEAEVAPAFVESTITAVHGAFVNDLAIPVTSFGAALEGGELYVVGGFFGEPHNYDREGQSRSLARLTSSGTWQSRAAMSTGLQGFSFVAAEGGLVRCGGSRIDNAPGAATDMHSIATCARYVGASDSWEAFPDLPAPRSSFDAAVLDGRIYAVGGWNIDGDQDHATFTDAMVVFDPATRAWTTETSPITRRALAVVATSHGIVAIGGLAAALAVSTSVDLYDPATHTWSQGPAFPGDGFGMAAAAIGDTIFASGSDGIVYRWTIGEAEWSRFHALAQPRFFHRLVPIGERMLAVGGIGAMTMDGRARLIESFSTTNPEAPAIGWADITFPGRARNRFGMFATEDSLYVFGGNDSPEQHDFAASDFVAEAFRFHVPSLRWYPIDPLAEARQSLESIVIGDGVVALGGFGHDGHSARTFADAFVVSDAGHFTISRDALPTGRTQFGAALYGDAVWIFAGLTFDASLAEDQQFTHLDDVLRCPVLAASPTPLGPCVAIEAHLPGTRRAFASASLAGHMFIVGGMREGFASVDDCLDFDFETRSFSALLCPAHPRISAAMLEHDGLLYLVGGSARTAEGLADDASIEVFDPATHTWTTTIETLPFDTHQGRWAFVADRLVMLRTQEEAGHATLAIVQPRPAN